MVKLNGIVGEEGTIPLVSNWSRISEFLNNGRLEVLGHTHKTLLLSFLHFSTRKPTDSPQPPLNYSNSLSVRSANQLTQVRLPQTITLANRHLLFLLTLLAYITFPTTALKIPPKLQTLYTSLLNPNNTCTFPLASDFYSSSHSDPTLVYCGDHLPDSAIIYLQGVNGQLADMDVDCDGEQQHRHHHKTKDKRCGRSEDTQGQTAFK